MMQNCLPQFFFFSFQVNNLRNRSRIFLTAHFLPNRLVELHFPHAVESDIESNSIVKVHHNRSALKSHFLSKPYGWLARDCAFFFHESTDYRSCTCVHSACNERWYTESWKYEEHTRVCGAGWKHTCGVITRCNTFKDEKKGRAMAVERSAGSCLL